MSQRAGWDMSGVRVTAPVAATVSHMMSAVAPTQSDAAHIVQGMQRRHARACERCELSMTLTAVHSNRLTLLLRPQAGRIVLAKADCFLPGARDVCRACTSSHGPSVKIGGTYDFARTGVPLCLWGKLDFGVPRTRRQSEYRWPFGVDRGLRHRVVSHLPTIPPLFSDGIYIKIQAQRVLR